MDKQSLIKILLDRYDKDSTYCDSCGGCVTKESTYTSDSYGYTFVRCSTCGLEDSGGPLIAEMIARLEDRSGPPIRTGHLLILADIMQDLGYEQGVDR